MRLQLRYFLAPKQGCTPDECEDALGLNLDARSFAVTDGATEAFAAGQWAQHLAHKWALSEVRPLEAFDFRAWVAAQGDIWHETWQEKKLPWYAEAKARDGSFATFVGLKLDLQPSPCWRVLALGDSCFFHRHNGKLLKALPVSDAAQFTNAPRLVPSRPAQHEAAFAEVVTATGLLQTGDEFWLASDAMSAWLLRAWAASDPLAEELEIYLRGHKTEELNALVAHQRQSGKLHNDDIALVCITVLETART